MRLPTRDVIASGLVGVAGLLYALWLTDSAPPGMSSTRATGIVILALGFAASANAVVPAFDRLLHGSKTYLAVASLIGVVALVGGWYMLVAGSEIGLGVVMTAMVVLWLIATIRHSLDARTVARARDRGPRIAQFGH